MARQWNQIYAKFDEDVSILQQSEGNIRCTNMVMLAFCSIWLRCFYCPKHMSGYTPVLRITWIFPGVVNFEIFPLILMLKYKTH